MNNESSIGPISFQTARFTHEPDVIRKSTSMGAVPVGATRFNFK